ncbi:GOLPH3/VPS74 family protein [Streptacidiphilus melanogenes]|uniref:GOLPH3/VPS74 family protein n=1 Tax=Streptacidiphilus melanogenes TaxID=411235 RepID=UPI0005A79553|nr:GPP34 family phosphoprotein [Streptacidiphilus melanogenes]
MTDGTYGTGVEGFTGDFGGGVRGDFRGGFTDATTCLPEDLLLLSARPTDGRVRQPLYLPHALSGAILAELLFAGALRFDGKRVHADANVPLRHPALAAAATFLLPTVVGPRGARLSTCLQRLRRRPGARPFLESLTAAGLLRRNEARLLGFIPATTHTFTDPAARASRVARIDATLASPQTAPPRDLALTTLAGTVDLTNHLHPTRPDRATRRLLADLTRADPVSSAVATSIRRARSAD